MKPRQESFLPALKIRADAAHGGDVGKGRRKTRRPLDPKRPMHLVMRASAARGVWSLQGHATWIDALIERLERRYRVRVYRHANVGNHLHLLLKAPSRGAFQGFLRELSGRIAQRVTGAVKGRAFADLAGGAKRFWDHLAYTRLITWGRQFETLQAYLIKNLFQAAGLYGPKDEAAGVRVLRASAWAAAARGG